MANNEIVVQGATIKVTDKDHQDYICLTDMVANFEGGSSLIDNWLRNKNTIEFLGVWEKINNKSFNSLEFEGIRKDAGTNRFTMSAKSWTAKTNGVGLIAKTGRYGGTYAHKDIALEFGSWLSPEFKLYLIKEFQRLKEYESRKENLEWNIRRTLSKAQYRVHTDAIKDHLIPLNISSKAKGFLYANEADMLNVVLFGMTAKEWKTRNPTLEGNIRDNATIEQLVVLAGLESQNALLIQSGMKDVEKRAYILNQSAISQMKSLLNNPSIAKLKDTPLDIDK